VTAEIAGVAHSADAGVRLTRRPGVGDAHLPRRPRLDGCQILETARRLDGLRLPGRSAPERRLLSAHQDLEPVTGPGVRGERNAVLDLFERSRRTEPLSASTSAAPVGHPQRFRAPRRLHGTEQLLAFYDVHPDCLVGQVRKRKTVDDMLAVFARLRSCYPLEVRLYVVMDNLNTHKHARLKPFMTAPQHRGWLHVDRRESDQRHPVAFDTTEEARHRRHRRPLTRIPSLADRPLPHLAQPRQGHFQTVPCQVLTSQVVSALGTGPAPEPAEGP
jgi:hypothetical protein